MNSLMDYLNEFNKLTLDLINEVNKGDFEAIDLLIGKRQKVISEVEGLNYNKEEFEKVCSKLNLVENNKELEKVLNLKREYLREEIDELNKSRKANNGYNSRMYTKSVVFSKKI